jgi:hypothetical protein
VSELSAIFESMQVKKWNLKIKRDRRRKWLPGNRKQRGQVARGDVAGV